MSDEDKPRTGDVIPFPKPSTTSTTIKTRYRDGLGDLSALSYDELAILVKEFAEKADYMDANLRMLARLVDSVSGVGKNAEKHIRALESTLETISNCLKSHEGLRPNQLLDRQTFIDIAREACSDLDQSRWPDVEWPDSLEIVPWYKDE